jgi:circadian clock protein KaiC
MIDKVTIHRLATGVPGLDAILGGGLPEYSFNLIAGPPGSGKTTLAHQIMFSLATEARPALFFTVLGETPLKMMRYQQQFMFFDPDKVAAAIRFVDLSDDVSTGQFSKVMDRITREVEISSPGFVVIDSFRSALLEASRKPSEEPSLQRFIQRLGIHLSAWQTTSVMVSESISGQDPHPIFTVADGLLLLDQHIYRNCMVRQIQVLKMRGQESRPGIQTFRISNCGIEIFPSALVRDDEAAAPGHTRSRFAQSRVAMGVPLLDEMMGGGLPCGYSLLVAGPSGSGKTVLATAFLAEGARLAEAGVIVTFEQTPSQSRIRTIDDLVRSGKVGLINTRSLDLSIDEITQRLVDLIQRMKAKRVVIDSLSRFELAVAPCFREDFRESLFRLVAVLASLGVTVLMTSELEHPYGDLRISPYGSAFLTDAIIVQRYIEIESRLKRVLAIVKVRGSAHSNELREFEITDAGIVIHQPLGQYEGILSGRPRRITESAVACRA